VLSQAGGVAPITLLRQLQLKGCCSLLELVLVPLLGEA
jgi:hypothetical protein